MSVLSHTIVDVKSYLWCMQYIVFMVVESQRLTKKATSGLRVGISVNDIIFDIKFSGFFSLRTVTGFLDHLVFVLKWYETCKVGPKNPPGHLTEIPSLNVDSWHCFTILVKPLAIEISQLMRQSEPVTQDRLVYFPVGYHQDALNVQQLKWHSRKCWISNFGYFHIGHAIFSLRLSLR